MLDTSELRAGYLPQNSIYEELYNQYCTKLKNQRRMDFDDQLVFAKLFLENKPELLSEFQNQYQYICVDEAQDVYNGCLPHSDRLTAIEQETFEEYEEERRLFYVVITRAINELHLFYIEEYGSEFIDEIIPTIKTVDETLASNHRPVVNMNETIIEIPDNTPDTILSSSFFSIIPLSQ